MKIALVLLIVVSVVVCSCSLAFARGRRGFGSDFSPEFSRGFEAQDFRCRQPRQEMRCGGRDGFGRFNGRFNGLAREIPDEIKAKFAEVRKMRIDLDMLLSAKEINKTQALEKFEAIQKLENEINTWRFVDRLEKLAKFQELQKPQAEADNAK